ncbi:MAG: hypothetical protein U1E94_05560 [Agitococcus sp.]
MLKKLALALLSVSVANITSAADVDLAQLQAQIKAQQAQIDALVAAVEKPTSTASTFSNITLGGYGEAYFKHIDGEKDEFDAYRLVLFVSHKFNDKVRFSSELEIEHAYVKDTDTGTASPSKTEGYVALEQLFLEYQYLPKHRVAAGQLLVPVGILNETHEPDTFYGTFRAPVEREIIPSTWFETGLMASGEIVSGLSYDAMLSSGLKNDGSKAIKEGRQRGSKADGSDLAYTARIKYTGIAGFEWGATWHHQTDMSQGAPKVANQNLDADLLETHIAVQKDIFGLRALYAKWDVNKSALAAADTKYAEQEGWYVEPSVKVLPTLGIFARYSEWDNTAADSVSSNWQEASLGLSWWLDERAVVKADLQRRDDPNGNNIDKNGFNLGIGFSF